MITLKFAALDYADPRANRYEYKLDGFDKDWVHADESRAATYTNLPGGHYVFRVRASNSDGVWSTQDLALPIDVAPSPWLSTLGVPRLHARSPRSCCSPSGMRSSAASRAPPRIDSSSSSR